MAFLDVKNYFRNFAVAQGLTEWRDALNIANIPENIVDKAFHVELGQFTQIQQNQDCIHLTMPLTFRFFVKAFRDTSGGYDKALAISETLLATVQAARNRATQTNIKNVQLSTGRLAPIDGSNDNTIMCEMIFSVLVIVEPS